MTDLDLLHHRLRPAAGEAQGALILLHGRGADELDLLPLLDELDPERRLVGLAPRAPLALDPGGYHWYVSRRVGHPDRSTFLESYLTLCRWLEAVAAAFHLPFSALAVGGFSMGAVMSYAVALAEGRSSPAAVLAFSGFIPTVDGFELDLGARRDLPVAIGHGIQDPVIPVEFGREARARLEDAGARVLYRESPMFHAIDPLFLRTLQGWLQALIAP